ncbi:helix-turn-helix domain-containing protein [Micromonospora sp. DT53]|uniref:helix-turn-helix domain-containing protein n=1 Tax=Micromonospora sp. DT53 TaxID=3393444 RepID=UPI003CF374B8
MNDPVGTAISQVRALADEIAQAPVRPDSVLAVLAGLAERRLPTDAEIDAERRFGQAGAVRGIPAESVVSAYHQAFRRIWEKLVEYAGPPRPYGLLDLADLLWSWLPVLTAAATDGYEEAWRRQRDDQRRDTAELIRLLATGQAGTEVCRALAHTLDFDPDGDFQVVSALDSQVAPEAAHWVVRNGRIVVITQDVGAVDLFAAPAVGVSLVRPGLAGAAAALLDADSALDLAVALHRPVDFRTDWLWITMLRHLHRLRPLLGAGRPADQPQFGQAARAYGDGGWSIAGAAENLGLHPNTVRYRLERLGQLANLDPRSIAGQRLSVLQDLVNEVDARRAD